MTEKTEIENQLATLAIDNDQEIANFVDLIDSSLEPYRVNVSKLGLEAGRESQKAITKQKNKVAKFFKEKRDYFNSMSKKIIGVEKTINAPLLELEEDLKAQCEAEVLRQEKAYKVSMRPIRQASLEGLGLHIDEEALDSMTDTEFNEQVSSMLAQIAQAKKEEEEAKARAIELEQAKKEAAEKAKKEAEAKAERDKQEALKAAEEEKIRAANKAAADLKAAQEKAEKDREEAEAKAKADKERILGESRYAIIEGLGLAGHTTASKQIVIEKISVMAEDIWEKSLETLKARKKEAEDKAKAEKQKALEEAEKARLQALKEKEKGLVMEYTEDDRFIVKHCGAVLTNVPVWCEDAEDACLYRAYSWVQPLIEKVYKLGKKDGYLEGSSDTASAIQSDISYRNGYLG
jgi:membrane protein involved in colicin uptake